MNFLLTDFAWALSLNGFIASSDILTKIAIFGASYAQYFVIGALFLLAFRSRDWMKVVAVSLAAAFIARVGVKELVLQFVARARPFHELSGIQALIPPPIDEVFQSFPSGHTIFFFAVATVVYMKDRRLGAYFYLAASFIGISRVAVGVHYPTDIVAGTLLGALTGGIVYCLYKKFAK